MPSTACCASDATPGLEVVNIRPRFIYGNHDRYVIPKLVKQVSKGWIPLVGGDAICDLVYVEDCVQALRLAAERPVAGESFNITSGECLSLRDILEQVAAALGQPIHFVSLPGPLVFAPGQRRSRAARESAAGVRRCRGRSCAGI